MSEIENNYPESFFRGVTEEGKIKLEYGRASADIFHFNGQHKNEKGLDEESINWNDDEGALENLKNIKIEKLDILKYERGGIVRIPTRKLKEMKNRYKDEFFYERKPVEGNDYHGNILLDLNKIDKVLKKIICSELVLGIDLIYTYNKEKCSWVETKTEIE